MTGIEHRRAQVRVNTDGEWKLRVFGTDIYECLYRFRHPEYDPFPGAAMGHRLIELGWMPDRRAALSVVGASTVQRAVLTSMSGWQRTGERWVWQMPVYREVECYAEGRRVEQLGSSLGS